MLRRFTVLLLMLSLSLRALGVVTVGWTCGGKPCSMDAFRCCCALPAACRDADCKSAATATNGCAGKCKCTASVSNQAPSEVVRAKADLSHAPILDVPVVVPQAAPWGLIPVRLPETPLLANPPPSQWDDASQGSANLRAPPAPLG